MKQKSPVIDAHAHCGLEDRFPPQAFEEYLSLVADSDIGAVVMFPPVAAVYHRYDPDFTDTDQLRKTREKANA